MEVKRIKVGELETNCYLLISKKELVVVDPGGDVDKILKEIKDTEAILRYIINTHNHFDHTLGNKELKEKTGAEILKGLKDGDEIKIGDNVLNIISTPGHTKDGICIICNNFILTGDTIFKDGYGRTDLFGGSKKELEESLNKLSKILKPGMVIYPGHGDSFIY